MFALSFSLYIEYCNTLFRWANEYSTKNEWARPAYHSSHNSLYIYNMQHNKPSNSLYPSTENCWKFSFCSRTKSTYSKVFIYLKQLYECECIFINIGQIKLKLISDVMWCDMREAVSNDFSLVFDRPNACICIKMIECVSHLVKLHISNIRCINNAHFYDFSHIVSIYLVRMSSFPCHSLLQMWLL